MSDRIRFSEHARITTDIMNDAFGYLEKADQNLVADLGINGIIDGLVVRPQHPLSDMSVVASGPGLAYDALGRRVRVGLSQTVDCTRSSNKENTAVVMPMHERWLSLGLSFARDETDSVRDQHNRPVSTRQLESFAFVLRAGAEGPSNHAERPALEHDIVHLCDIRLQYEQMAIDEEHIDTSRRRPLRLWQAHQIRARSESWASLPRAASLQAALDSIDSVLGEIKDQAGKLVSSRWQTLPATNTTQEALDDVDALLTNHVAQIEALQEQVSDFVEHRFFQGTRVHEVVIVTKDIAVPRISARGSLRQSISIEGMTANYRIINAQPADEDLVTVLRVTPGHCFNGGVRLQIDNLIPRDLEIATRKFEFIVVVPKAAHQPATSSSSRG